MSAAERIVVQFLDVGALLPRDIELASFQVDAHFEPVLVFHARRTPPYTPQPILHILGGWALRPMTRLDNPGATFPLVQPVDDGWLLLDSRAQPGRRANGWRLSHSGDVQSQAFFGDGIRDLQIDENEGVWVSRFDEGRFSGLEDAFCRGLSRFGADGSIRWLMPWEPAEFDIADCYAMNVVSAHEVWTCYYTDFPLVRITDDQPEVLMDSSVAGADALAVAGELVFFAPAYEGSELTLVDTNARRILKNFSALDPEGSELGRRPYVRARGNRMYFWDERGLAGVELRPSEPFVRALVPTAPADSTPGT